MKSPHTAPQQRNISSGTEAPMISGHTVCVANARMMLTVLVALGLALLCAAGPAAAKNCGCQTGYCCSKAGYCGTTSDYCGAGCKSGPCTYGSGGGSGGDADGVNVGNVVTDEFFNGIKSQARSDCEGSNFYSRDAFLNAVNMYSGFAQSGSEADGKREIAAFFAHATLETGSFCYISEIDKSNAYCDRDPRYSQWPCAEGKKYYGRGPLQLSWNYNYGGAGSDNNFDGLGNPDVVAQNPGIAFKAALWFWMKYVHKAMPQGFGATIKAINGDVECDGKNTDRMNARVSYYQQYCQQLGVDPGSNLTC